MTKGRLIDTLRTKRAEFDSALSAIPRDAMTMPGAAGHWSVKDVVAHVMYYERWMADRMHEQLRGEKYEPDAVQRDLDNMHWEPRNDRIYELVKDMPLEDVLIESCHTFDRLIEAVEAHSEEFLIEPQEFDWPEPITVWKMLRSEVYDHYGQHIPSLKEWTAARKEMLQ